jgi:hypothetical protein
VFAVFFLWPKAYFVLKHIKYDFKIALYTFGIFIWCIIYYKMKKKNFYEKSFFFNNIFVLKC